MKSAWIIVLLLLSLVLVGCSGSSEPVNDGKDKPVHPKKEKDQDK